MLIGKQKKDTPKQASRMALAAKWPVHKVLLSRGWDQPAALITILVVRRSPMAGKVAAGLLLVDLACLGVKSAQVKLFAGPAEYGAGLCAHALRIQPMAPSELKLVAKIVSTGLAYAAGLGLGPDPVFAQAGPHDDANRIIGQLTRMVGEGNFHYMLGEPDGDFDLLEV